MFFLKGQGALGEDFQSEGEEDDEEDCFQMCDFLSNEDVLKLSSFPRTERKEEDDLVRGLLEDIESDEPIEELPDESAVP